MRLSTDVFAGKCRMCGAWPPVASAGLYGIAWCPDCRLGWSYSFGNGGAWEPFQSAGDVRQWLTMFREGEYTWIAGHELPACLQDVDRAVADFETWLACRRQATNLFARN